MFLRRLPDPVADARAEWRKVDQCIVIPDRLLEFASESDVSDYREGYISAHEILAIIAKRISL